MYSNSNSPNYRSLLLQQGKGFPEAKIQGILKQVLPQLAQLNNLGQVHGAISLDTLLEVNGVSTLTTPFVYQPVTTAAIAQDISDLGKVITELLSGKIGINEQGDWEDHCTVSDRSSELVNAMIQNVTTIQFRSVTEVLAFNPTYAAISNPIISTPVYTQAPISPQYQPPQENIQLPKKQNQTVIAIASGLIFGLVAIAIFLVTNNSSKNPQPIAISPSPATQAVSTQDTPVVVPSQPQTVTTPAPIQAESKGWIRLGAVKNTSGYAAVGDALISTTQPVTISPMVVPALNDRVITISGVNLRDDAPKPPLYKIGGKVNTLLANQKLQILNIKTFVDTNSSSPYTIVWAEVGLPKTSSVSSISTKPLDKPGLYLTSTTLSYSDGDRLKADFRVYCPTSTIRPTNYVLTDRNGTVKKEGLSWETAFTPKHDSEYQLIKEVCNKN